MKKKGFTLIELIVVVIIIGILASIIAPIISNIKARAICAEAITGLATIRTILRLYYVEYGHYTTVIDKPLTDSSVNIPGLSSANFLGTYFSPGCYYVIDGASGFLSCFVKKNNTVAVKHTDTWALEVHVNGDTADGGINMDLKTGRITQRNVPKSGYTNYNQ